MIKFISLLLILGYSVHPCMAQKEKTKSEVLSPEATRQLLNSMNFDTTKFLAESSRNACLCIDSFMHVKKAGDGTNNIKEVSNCIDKQVTAYGLSLKILKSLTGTDKNIIINTDKNSQEYKQYYRDIETWVMDSCSALRRAIGSNDEKETELSFSKDPEAIKQYNSGIQYFNNEDYGAALPFFKKATETDPAFVFAWDNLGICYRRTGDLDNALMSYNKSLRLSPKGKTPLQNIPVVYEMQKDYSKAIEAYKNFLHYYPDDVEAYYGIGRISIVFTNDLETGVDYMCKAYNLYVKNNSPYRADAEKNIAYAYSKMKELGKEEIFFKILKDNNISTK